MAENLENLIAKIQQEGVRAAEDKAREIEGQAKKQAESIIKEAGARAEEIRAAAKAEAGRLQETVNASLKQAGRDLILNLKKEISRMLDKIIRQAAAEALKPEELARIIGILIKEYAGKEAAEIEVRLSKKDLERLEKDFLGRLKKESEKGISLRPSEEISAGLVISYDAGKSCYDFTDKAIAEYIGKYLRPKLDTLLGIPD